MGRGATDRRMGAPARERTVGQQWRGGGGEGEGIGGAANKDACAAKLLSSSLTEILAQTRRSWRAIL